MIIEGPTLIYLTIPAPSEQVLNIQHGDHFLQFRLTKEQLYNMNLDIADALIRGSLSRLTQQEKSI